MFIKVKCKSAQQQHAEVMLAKSGFFFLFLKTTSTKLILLVSPDSTFCVVLCNSQLDKPLFIDRVVYIAFCIIAGVFVPVVTS